VYAATARKPKNGENQTSGAIRASKPQVYTCPATLRSTRGGVEPTNHHAQSASAAESGITPAQTQLSSLTMSGVAPSPIPSPANGVHRPISRSIRCSTNARRSPSKRLGLRCVVSPAEVVTPTGSTSPLPR
jgi:hypothetical protein